MAIEQWVFLSMPHLMLHGASVNNGNLQGPVILTPIAKRFVVHVLLPVFTVCRGWDSNIQTFRLQGESFAQPLRL